MGLKGTIRSIQAAQRRAEREALRRQRELERQQKQIEKMQELERAAYEVEVYENHIDLLLSVHKECGEPVDWERLSNTEPPLEPKRSHIHKEAAQARLDGYRPGIMDKVLRRTKSKQERLVEALEEARQADEHEYQEAIQVYKQDYADGEAVLELAKRMLSGESKHYLDVIQYFDPFSDISHLGSSLDFQIESQSLVTVVIHVNSEQVVPSEAKSLLKSGRLSVKQMPKGKFYELYQDYVCGCVLRVARELFALLPLKMVVVTAMGSLLNTQTGYMEEQAILSVAIPRKTLQDLNFEMIDPSDSMKNFVHRMSFKKTKGFEVVEALALVDLQTTQ